MFLKARFFAPVLFLILTACPNPRTAFPPPPEQPQNIYRGVGTEPGWIVEIGPSQIVYNGDYGEKKITVATPVPRPTFNGMRYVTERLTVDITYSPCNDGMSDRRYADSLLISADGDSVRGCGGNILPPENLDNTNWSISLINEAPVSDTNNAEMRFLDGQLIASVGCNQLTANYSLRNDLMTIGPVRSTRRACTEPLASQESALAVLLGSSLSVHFYHDGNMTLSGAGKTVVLTQKF